MHLLHRVLNGDSGHSRPISLGQDVRQWFNWCAHKDKLYTYVRLTFPRINSSNMLSVLRGPLFLQPVLRRSKILSSVLSRLQIVRNALHAMRMLRYALWSGLLRYLCLEIEFLHYFNVFIIISNGLVSS